MVFKYQNCKNNLYLKDLIKDKILTELIMPSSLKKLLQEQIHLIIENEEYIQYIKTFIFHRLFQIRLYFE